MVGFVCANQLLSFSNPNPPPPPPAPPPKTGLQSFDDTCRLKIVLEGA